MVQGLNQADVKARKRLLKGLESTGSAKSADCCCSRLITVTRCFPEQLQLLWLLHFLSLYGCAFISFS
jgi:hypothetical protein